MADISIGTPLHSPQSSIDTPVGYKHADYSRRGNAASVRAGKVRVQCGHCGLWFSSFGIYNHQRICLNLEPPAFAPTFNLRELHNECACGRRKATEADTCYRCSTYPRDPEFQCLDILINAQIDISRGKLEMGGAPVDDPRLLAAWVIAKEEQKGHA